MTPAFTLLRSDTNTDYVIYVEAPPAEEAPGPHPAVVFMDGDDQFAPALAAYRDLRGQAAVPPLVLVGVGYGASYTRPRNRRGRDYTPTAHSDEPASGGADGFLRFLRDTLWPELARRYPLQDEIRGVAGHSLGSLLVLHALWRDPPFFTHYLASAPSIWWDDRSILRLAQERRARGASLPARLFLSVGEEDTPSMTGDFDLLERQLAAQPFTDLDITSRRIAKRDHYNVLPDAFRAGLSVLFGKHSRE